MFKCLTFVEKNPDDGISEEIISHLSQLKTELLNYLPDIGCCAYSINPFYIDPADVLVETGEQEELINIQTDETAKIKHKECCPINLWLSMASSYANLARLAVSQLLIFPSTWKCEQGFSALIFDALSAKLFLAVTSWWRKNNIHRIRTICCVLLVFGYLSSWTDVRSTLIQLHANPLCTDVYF